MSSAALREPDVMQRAPRTQSPPDSPEQTNKQRASLTEPLETTLARKLTPAIVSYGLKSRKKNEHRLQAENRTAVIKKNNNNKSKQKKRKRTKVAFLNSSLCLPVCNNTAEFQE